MGSGPLGDGPQRDEPSESRGPGACFGPERRLHNSREFREAQSGALRVQTEPFVVLVHRRSGAEGPSRLGLVASRKVGTAARRNRIKRLLREAFRKGAFSAPQGTDIVVILRAGLSDMSQAEVERVLGAARNRLKKAFDQLEMKKARPAREQKGAS